MYQNQNVVNSLDKNDTVGTIREHSGSETIVNT